MMYLWLALAGFLLMVVTTALHRRALRQGEMPRPRWWLAVCWVFFITFGVTIAMVIAWDDTSSWACFACIGASFLAACKAREDATVAAVLIALKANPGGIYGLDLWKASQVAPGSLYPLLFRLEKRGVVRSWWGEQPENGSARRRYYALTEEAAWRR